jgi:hypothetical protein
MANTHKLIEAKTLASAVNSITFSSIPQTYTDLKLLISARGTSASFFTQGLRLTFNSITSGYTTLILNQVGDNRTPVSSTNPYTTSAAVSQFINNAASTASTFGNTEVYIPNYTSSNDKSYSVDYTTESNSNGWYDVNSGFSAVSVASSTAAITSITFTSQSGEGDLAINSTFYLYGIKNS